jgi:RNA polymerase sigma factor (sigma-70 family)
LERLAQADDPLARRMTIDGFKDWLSCLRPREREVVALRYGADMPASEIAEMLDLSVANVHQILSRSTRRLRDIAEASVNGKSQFGVGSARAGNESSDRPSRHA